MFVSAALSLLLFTSLIPVTRALNAVSCASSSSTGFPVFAGGKAAPVLAAGDDWPGVHIALHSFAADINLVTGVSPTISNWTTSWTPSSQDAPIIVGTLGHSSLIDAVVKNAAIDVSSVQGKWEAFWAGEVANPLPGVAKAYVLIGADKRGTIYNVYTHSESFGVSPWYWWADVPAKKSSSLYASGCAHGSPTVKYRGIFLNDEQPAIQNWAQEKFNKDFTNAPFNSLFYVKVFELILRLKGNYMWPAIWSSMFCVDDPLNQMLADLYGVIHGTSHQEPLARSSPMEFNLYQLGQWSFQSNRANVTKYFVDGVNRAKPYETLFTLGMRGSGDLPLPEGENIVLMEDIVATQRQILADAYVGVAVDAIPQMWCLYKEVQSFYDHGMQVPDSVTLLWADDNWGNVRRFPLKSERGRSGGAGVYYHIDYVGDPRDYKWIQSSQISKIHEQMSLAVEREATRIWIVNVGDLKPYERDTEFFLSMGYNSSVFTHSNLESAYVGKWVTREFGLTGDAAQKVVDIVGKFTQWNAVRKPELLNTTTFSFINYREAETWVDNWDKLAAESQQIHDSLPAATRPAFYQLVNHPVQASANLNRVYYAAGLSNLRASQARYVANEWADQAFELFDHDYDYELEYHGLLDGKWNHFMEQTHIGYFYWQQPMTNSLGPVSRVQKRKQALAGYLRIGVEGSLGAWPGDNSNQCAQGYNCPPPTAPPLDPFVPAGNRYFDISSGGPAEFTWNATADKSWVKFSVANGIIEADHLEERVFVSVDWNAVPSGSSTATITIRANSAGQAPMSTTVILPVVKTAPAAGFKGFVEGDGVISIEAAHFTSSAAANGVTWTELPGYGRTLSAVTPLPALGNNESKFAIGSGPKLEYAFFNFNTLPGGLLNITTYVSPSHNAIGDDRRLAFAVQIDDGAPQLNEFMPLSRGQDVPAGWATNDGYVANAIVYVQNSAAVAPGSHVFRLWGIEPAVVIQKIVINTGGLRPSYLGPPESVRV